MKAQQAKEVLVPGFIDLELSADKAVIDKGQTVSLRWRVHGDAQLTLWEGAAALDTENLDWNRIRELGEHVEASGQRRLTPAQTTGYYLLARTPQGIRGEKVVVEVREDRGEPAPAVVWSPKKEFLNRMEERAYVRRPALPPQFQPEMLVVPIEMLLRWAQQWSCGSAPPGINVSTSNSVIFENESATVTWTVTNATCVTPAFSVFSDRLIAGSVCGTQPDGGSIGSGGWPPCVEMSGSITFPFAPIGASHIVVYIDAVNPSQSASASAWIDVLSVPQFKGSATASRIDAIKVAIKNIDKNLRGGCIYNDASLDTKVAAFKTGKLQRQAFWQRLLTELQNLKLDTFVCNDVSDQKWFGGHWADYTYDILLEWSPSHAPNLEYVILEELVHKCGFNSALGYSHDDVEEQAYTVASSCYP